MKKAMIDKDRDLKGATPETLAKALLRSSLGTKPVVSDKVSVKQVAAHKSGDRGTHLKEGS